MVEGGSKTYSLGWGKPGGRWMWVDVYAGYDPIVVVSGKRVPLFAVEWSQVIGITWSVFGVISAPTRVHPGLRRNAMTKGLTVKSLDHSIKYCFDRLVALNLLERTDFNKARIESNVEGLTGLYAKQDLLRALEAQD